MSITLEERAEGQDASAASLRRLLEQAIRTRADIVIVVRERTTGDMRVGTTSLNLLIPAAMTLTNVYENGQKEEDTPDYGETGGHGHAH